jgi:hypothetical protein
MGLLDIFKGKATLKTGYQSELDLFFHGFNQDRQSRWLENPLRKKEIIKHEALFKKRDMSVDLPESKVWQDF